MSRLTRQIFSKSRSPYPYRIGTDICHIPRIKKLITGSQSLQENANNPNHLLAFLSKLFVGNEIVRFWRKFYNPRRIFSDDVIFNDATRFLAGRWAAKEAVIKAIPSQLHMRDIVVLAPYSTRFPPDAFIFEHRLKTIAKDEIHRLFIHDMADMTREEKAHKHYEVPMRRHQIIPISISHDGDYATASCIATSEELSFENSIHLGDYRCQDLAEE